jgi:membrane associated rhomboid family serine protease
MLGRYGSGIQRRQQLGPARILRPAREMPPRRILGLTISGETLTSLCYAATWIGLQLLTGLAFNGGGGMMQIAIWTHIGGFLTGLAAARIWGKGPQPD